jgi:hypothetical protein
MTTYKSFTDDTEEWFSSKPAKAKKTKSGCGFSFKPNQSNNNTRTPTVVPIQTAAKAINKETDTGKSREVMVKVSGSSKGMQGITAHMNYIARNGDVILENENGTKSESKDDVYKLANEWRGMGIHEQDGKKRECLHIVLSMGEGNNPEAIRNAARNFAEQEFSGHRYVMALHQDTKNPHVHLAVSTQDVQGHRINPRKEDLFNWRVEFAEKLKEQGIEATATRRVQRFAAKKPEKFAIWQIKQEAEGKFKVGRNPRKRKMPDVVVKQAQEVAEALRKGSRPVNPAQTVLEENRSQTLESYRRKQAGSPSLELAKLIERGERTEIISTSQSSYDRIVNRIQDRLPKEATLKSDLDKSKKSEKERG